MATYKVIQDIEAEDKLLGPFSLRQFVYLIIVAISLFVGYKLVSVAWYLVLPLLPHTLFFAMLAAPLGREQSSEVWLLAKIRFAIKPRRRIWDQSGMRQLVTITAPKKIEKPLTKNLSETEVRSRLQALADTIDSRGWAIKNVNVNLFAQPSLVGAGAGSDRLVDAGAGQQAGPASDVQAADDMLDPQANPTAQYLDQMIHASSQAHRKQIMAQMKQNDQPPASNPTPPPGPPAGQPSKRTDNAQTPPADYWFLNSNAGQTVQPQPSGATFQSNIVTPDPSVVPPPWTAPKAKGTSSAAPALDEEALLQKIHAEKDRPKNYGHLRVIKPIAEQQAEAAAKKAQAAQAPAEPPVTQTPDPAILELASNDDLNVATIARQANKKGKKHPPDDEVVINLH